MTIEVTELAPGDIQRAGGVSTDNTQPAGFRQDGAQDGGQAAPAEMSAEQQAGIQKLGEMRARYGDSTLTGQQREALMARMSELSRHVFTGTAKPSWFGEAQPDPRATSNAEYDPMQDMNAAASAVLTASERDHLVLHAKVKGLSAEQATEVVGFCTTAGLDKVTARVITERFAKHTAGGWGMGAALSQEEHADLQADCVRRFGTVEKATAENAMARAYIEHVGLAQWVDKNGGSIQYDPQVITMLAYKGRCLGLKAK